MTQIKSLAATLLFCCFLILSNSIQADSQKQNTFVAKDLVIGNIEEPNHYLLKDSKETSTSSSITISLSNVMGVTTSAVYTFIKKLSMNPKTIPRSWSPVRSNSHGRG
jgi:hypothetical protein